MLCSGAVLIPSLMSCVSAKRITLAEKDNLLRLLLSEFTGDTLVVESSKLQFPILLIKSEKDKYSALLMQCSHKGCELHSEGSYLVCPCHGSEFDSTGRAISAPADKPLRSYPVNVDDLYLYIDIS